MIRAAILVISSKILHGDSSDTGRPDLEQYLADNDIQIMAYEIVPDDREEIRERLLSICTTVAPQVILTLGGTGVRPTDWAPEATRDVIEKEIPGIGEVMRKLEESQNRHVVAWDSRYSGIHDYRQSSWKSKGDEGQSLDLCTHTRSYGGKGLKHASTHFLGGNRGV